MNYVGFFLRLNCDIVIYIGLLVYYFYCKRLVN